MLPLGVLSFFLPYLVSSRSPPQPPLSQADEDEITWGSDELPIESISQERVNKGKTSTNYQWKTEDEDHNKVDKMLEVNF